MSAKGAFERLHPAVQRRLWEMQWTEMRPIQTKAIHHLLDGRGDCVITVPTAGGKTEAAFLPILSRIADEPSGGVRAMYVGPLKALINDQFRRIENLCTRMEMPVHRWHGDVGEGPRKRLLGRPTGVLLITPESLEAMFVLRPTKMPHIFSRLSYVVIDELHAFIGTERGAQLQCQIERLCARANCNPVRVGLSATLGDTPSALRWLRPSGPPAQLLDDPDASRELQVRVRGFWNTSSTKDLQQSDDASDDQTDEVAFATMARAILVAVNGTTNLVFANAKSVIESLADTMKEEATSIGVRDEVVVHHGSLSKSMREYAEERLSSGSPVTAVCSNTLELGIDVGRIENVVQLSSPPSVASLVQRIGRSGRTEGAPAKLRAYFLERRPDADTSTWGRLHLEYLRGVASIELMRERFLEPIEIGRGHHSTLVQQILSILAETGGTNASNVYARLKRSGAFGVLESGTFAQIVRELGRHTLIEQMAEGDLILAPKGQRLAEHYSFYAAFKTPDEVAVFYGAEKIGMLPSDAIPGLGEHVILAGKRWQVVQIDVERREVVVERARGKRPPTFRSAFADTHPAVHAKMRSLALGNELPNYLDATALEILAAVRDESKLLGGFVPRIQSGGAGTLLFVWAGRRVCRTLHLSLRMRNIEAYDMDVGLDVAASPTSTLDALRSFKQDPDQAEELAALAESELGARVIEGEKYDEFLPNDVWRKSYGRERLDVRGAVFTVEQVLQST